MSTFKLHELINVFEEMIAVYTEGHVDIDDFIDALIDELEIEGISSEDVLHGYAEKQVAPDSEYFVQFYTNKGENLFPVTYYVEYL